MLEISVDQMRPVRDRAAGGALPTPADEYFLMTPTMETSAEAYSWLNHVQCVGKMVEVKTGDHSFVKYDIFVAR